MDRCRQYAAPIRHALISLDVGKVTAVITSGMPPTGRQRWARVPPHLAWKHPGMPTEWTRVIEEMPADMLYPLLPGYVRLDARKDRPLRAWAAHPPW